MGVILKREVKNYVKSPLLWIGIAAVAFMVFQNVRPYLQIHYLAEGEEIVNEYPETFRDGDVFDGYVPIEGEQRRKAWEERIQKTLLSAFLLDPAGAQAVIDEMKEMDVPAACNYLEDFMGHTAFMRIQPIARGRAGRSIHILRKSWKAERFHIIFQENSPILRDCFWDFLRRFFYPFCLCRIQGRIPGSCFIQSRSARGNIWLERREAVLRSARCCSWS